MTTDASLDGHTSRLYHRLSAYTYDAGDLWPRPIDHPLVRQDFKPNHLPTFPSAWKTYAPGLPTTGLPIRWAVADGPATAVLAGKVPVGPAADLDVGTLGRLLHLTAGVVRVVGRRDGYRTFYFRTSRSAGGLFPVELYLASRDVEGLPDGVHWYDPMEHALRQVGPAPEGRATSIVVTAVPWRTGWRYSERGLRHVYWDAGGAIAQAALVAASAGIDARVWTAFPDAQVARLVGADGVHEFPVAVIGLGAGEPAIGPTGPAARAAVDPGSIEFPLVITTHAAGNLDRLGEPWPGADPLPGAPPPSSDLDSVIQVNRSTRVMDASGTVPRATFEWIVGASARRSRVELMVAVHAVDDLAPGLYAWPNLDRPVRRGRLRDDIFRLCWDQALGRDAAFVAITVLDLRSVDDHGYREAQLDAGGVDSRMHLAAYARGLGASGMTFADSEVRSVLGVERAGLLLTCVGRPVGSPRLAATPGVRGIPVYSRDH